ncbi:MAG: PKD domain-containing protein [Planctomycetota bacterium]|nr:PKD domain-containing protein [Planctomycetota bacterium]
MRFSISDFRFWIAVGAARVSKRFGTTSLRSGLLAGAVLLAVTTVGDSFGGTVGWPTLRQDAGGTANQESGAAFAVPLNRYVVVWTAGTANCDAVAADITGDSKLEVVITDANGLHAYDCGGNLLWEKTGGSQWCAVLADVNGDGKAEVAASYRSASTTYTIKVYDGSGTELKSITFPTAVASDENVQVAGVVDLDNNGTKQIVLNVCKWYYCGVWVFEYASGAEKWHYDVGAPIHDFVFADVDNDGKQEIIIGYTAVHNGISANGFNDSTAYVICYKSDGTLKWYNPIGTWGADPSLVDIDGDGSLDVVVARNQDWYGGNLAAYVLNPATGAQVKQWIGAANYSSGGRAVGHLRAGTGMQLVLGEVANGNWVGIHLLDANLTELAFLSKTDEASFVVATCDLDGDGLDEVIVEHGSSVAAYDGSLNRKWLFPLGATTTGHIAVADIDGDGRVEVLVPTSAGLKVLAVWPPVITSPTTADGTVGLPFSYTVAATKTPTSFNATGLPTGLSVNTSTGLISGTPTAGGNYRATISATNSCGTGSATLDLAIAMERQKIVYVSDADGWQNIWIMNPDGTEKQQLTFTTGPTYSSPHISPDGTRIAFGSDRGATWEFWVMNVDGSNARQLTNVDRDECCTWSPDGSRLAFSGFWNAAGRATFELGVINADGTGQTIIHSTSLGGGWLSWKPDSETIFFSQETSYNWSPSNELWRIQSDGTGLTQLTSNAVGDYMPSVSPDGTKLLYAKSHGAPGYGDERTHRMNVDGTGDLEILDLAGDIYQTSWSPDGAKFAFEVCTGGAYDIGIANADGSGVTLIASSLALERFPDWGIVRSLAPPAISSATSANGTVGVPFSYTITASNAPTSFSAANLPDGLSLDAGTGTITGWPNVAGSFNVEITASNAGGTGTATLDLTIAKGTPTITWNNPADITYPTALGATQLNATVNVAGTIAYTPVSGTVLNAGAGQTLSVQFTPTDTANYNTPAARNVSINVLKATPVITWANPADVTYPYTLGSVQLNATVAGGMAGSLAYSPATGTELNAGSGQKLSVTFTPQDTANCNSASKTVTLNVLPGILSLNAEPNPAKPGEVVTFTLGGAGGMTVTWDFGDGTTGSGATATHTYNAEGFYKVTASLSDGTSTFTQSLTVEVRSPANRVITDFIIAPNPADVGKEMTFTAIANANAGTVIFQWDFGDGATDTGVTTKHAYAQPGEYTVVLTAYDLNGLRGSSSQKAYVMTDKGEKNIDDPSKGGQGVENKLNGLKVRVADSNNAVIALEVDVNAVNRDAFEIKTDFGTGRTPVGGLRPVNKFETSGIYIATTTAADIATSEVKGKARKTLSISRLETGENPLVKNVPASTQINLNSLKGKFIFADNGQGGAKPDAVSYITAIELPEGYDVKQEHSLSLAVGNVVDMVTITDKGGAASQGRLGRIKKLQIKYPKLPKGTTVLSAGRTAKVYVTLSTTSMSQKGFDTEGITPTLAAGEAGHKSLARSIQMAFVLDGVAYESQAAVQFSLLGKNGEAGQISGRGPR